MEVELRNKAIADSIARKNRADSLAQKSRADSLAQKNKAVTDSTLLKNKALVDSTAQKNKALVDTTAQKRTAVPQVQQKLPGMEEPPVKKSSRDSLAVPDSSQIPQPGAQDTTRGRRKKPVAE
jgi:hypothetical protein